MKNKWLEPSVVAAVFLLDRAGKFFILERLYFKSAEVLPFFSFTYVENTGVAFGLFRDSNRFFIVLSAALIAGLLLFRRKHPARPPAVSAGLALVLGGALGNLYDRLVYGHVVDFFDFSFFPAVFNVADSAITVGAAFLAFGLNKADSKR